MIYSGWSMNFEFSIIWIVVDWIHAFFKKENLGYWGLCWGFLWRLCLIIKKMFLGVQIWLLAIKLSCWCIIAFGATCFLLIFFWGVDFYIAVMPCPIQEERWEADGLLSNLKGPALGIHLYSSGTYEKISTIGSSNLAELDNSNN